MEVKNMAHMIILHEADKHERVIWVNPDNIVTLCKGTVSLFLLDGESPTITCSIVVTTKNTLYVSETINEILCKMRDL